MGRASVVSGRLVSATVSGSFVSVLVSTKLLNTGLPLSPVIKYSIFLLLLPLTLWLSMSLGIRPDPGAVFATVTRCGNLFLLWVLLSLALGQSGGSGDEFAIHILGQPVYKNQLGHYLVFVSIANFLSWCLRHQARFLLPFALAILTSLALDVRGPVAASLMVAFYTYLRFFGLRPGAVLGIVAMGLLAVLLGVLVILSGLFEAQLSRFSELSTMSDAGDTVSSTQSRLLLWAFGWRMMLENPVFGVGHGGFFYNEGEGWLYGMYQPHNNLVQIGAEGGFLGLLLFLALLWAGISRRDVPREVTALRILAAAYLVTTLVDIIWVRGTGHLFWALFFLQAFCMSPRALGSSLIEFHSQKRTVAASMIAEKKVSGHRSYRVATRLQSFRRPNMISMRLRRL